MRLHAPVDSTGNLIMIGRSGLSLLQEIAKSVIER